jgi:lysophospholipase L1-like esterase
MSPLKPTRPLRPGPIACAVGLAALCLSACMSACMFETRHQPPLILFLGNSLTWAPKTESVGWPHDGGMAASRPDKGYVQETLRILRAKGMDVDGVLGSRDCEICESVIGEHMENIDELDTLKPRYVVVQLGENASLAHAQGGQLTREYKELLASIYARGKAEVFCIGQWDEASLAGPRNDAIRKAMLSYPKAHFVDIKALAGKREYYGDSALYSNKDVLWHPGDAGMLAIAESLSAAIWEHR